MSCRFTENCGVVLHLARPTLIPPLSLASLSISSTINPVKILNYYSTVIRKKNLDSKKYSIGLVISSDLRDFLHCDQCMDAWFKKDANWTQDLPRTPFFKEPYFIQRLIGDNTIAGNATLTGS